MRTARHLILNVVSTCSSGNCALSAAFWFFSFSFLYHCLLQYYPSSFHGKVTVQNFPVDSKTLLLMQKSPFHLGGELILSGTNFTILINTQFDTYRIPIWTRGASISKVTWKTLKQKRECLFFIIQDMKVGLNTEYL